ncbi:MAG: hypothetical protein KatS3mg132_628 [Limisphaera sp.]|nr:MAG: hypothetical protein KatS3mg132_628 [Limisphaera sp.]
MSREARQGMAGEQMFRRQSREQNVVEQASNSSVGEVGEDPGVKLENDLGGLHGCWDRREELREAWQAEWGEHVQRRRLFHVRQSVAVLHCCWQRRLVL